MTTTEFVMSPIVAFVLLRGCCRAGHREQGAGCRIHPISGVDAQFAAASAETYGVRNLGCKFSENRDGVFGKIDSKGLIYILQRGADADPVIAVDRQGRIVRSWGRGLYKIPHSIRIDGDGNVWTVDAGSSMVYKFSADGKHQLKEINVGGLPTAPRSPFCGTTDIAFARDRILIADGYGNARIVEYSNEGKRLREWGVAGESPGQFWIPHAIAIDEEGIIYVADRENGRIQRFSPERKYLDEWRHWGRRSR